MLMIGKTLGHYEITSQLGKGGMGEVYRAKDLTLSRDVAIKVLPPEFAQDPERIARFQREAKVLASLNHPNIAAIYGLEESGGTNFLVLELVHGETLADRLKRGPIPIDEALKLALQIAEALEAAHEKGIIHRDLKPSNIKVSANGKVKVLDFGLAKALSGDQAEGSATNSPTLSMAATQQGIILGTAAYMSPEQARGRIVDKRTDIWSFGCVLFEMLTGQPAFEGEDVSEILASVIKADVHLDRLPATTHPRLRELLSRCLQKDLKNRYQDIGDVRFEAGQLLSNSALAQSPPTSGGRAGLRLVLPWIAATAVVVGILASVAIWKFRPSEPHPITRFSCILPANQSLIKATQQLIAVSPDGRQIVYATTGGLYLRSLDQLEGRIIPGTEGEVADPFFSPDGQWVGYWSGRDRQLKKIPISGGAPVTICSSENNSNASWNTTLTILFDGSPTKGIMRVSADGGTPEEIVPRKNDFLFAPTILPDGDNLLFTVVPSGQLTDMKIAVQSLASGKRKVLFAGQGARYLPTGHLVYVQGGNLFAVPFDPKNLVVTGGAVPVVQGIATNGPALCAVSDSGVLVYEPGVGRSMNRILVWVDRNGREEAIEAPPRAYTYAHLSPDGTRIALDIRDQENDIWIWNLQRKTLSRLTFDPGMNRGGVWSADGKRVAFSAERNGSDHIYWQAADGSGTPESLTKVPKAPGTVILPMAFSPDGKQLLFNENASVRHISLLNLDGSSESKQLLASAFNQANPQISPDGRWLAYESDESGRQEVYVRPFPDVNAGRWQISTEGGTRPLWNRNGRELFYYLMPGIMMSVPVETGTSFKAGSPTVVFRGDYPVIQNGTQYSVTPDGKRFLMIKDAAVKPGAGAPPQQINIVLNWIEELKQRVPPK